MKAAVLYDVKKPLVIENSIEIPALKPGQVLVRLAYSGICHSQLMEARGKRGEDKYLPHMLGHEGSGVVDNAGEGTSKVKAGDHVVLGWIKGDGMDVKRSVYKKGDIKINAGAVTTLSEYSIVSENRCVKLPHNIPLDIAVLFGCAIPTGAGILINEIRPKPKTTIALFGLGGVGLSALMATSLFDLKDIIAVDIEDKKLRLASELGATHIINSEKRNPVDAIAEITCGEGVDYSVEAAGLTFTIEQAFKVLKPGSGLCIFASHPKSGEMISLDPHELICGKNIRGSWGGGTDPDRDIPRFAKFYKEGKFKLEKLISKAYTLDNINQALDDLENRKIIRALIEIDPAFKHPKNI